MRQTRTRMGSASEHMLNDQWNQGGDVALSEECIPGATRFTPCFREANLPPHSHTNTSARCLATLILAGVQHHGNSWHLDHGRNIFPLSAQMRADAEAILGKSRNALLNVLLQQNTRLHIFTGSHDTDVCALRGMDWWMLTIFTIFRTKFTETDTHGTTGLQDARRKR